jgi:hypothetical protein
MPQRPRVVILISLWVWVQTLWLLNPHVGAPPAPGTARQLWSLLVGIFGIGFGIGLFQMRPRARIIAIVVVAISAVNMLASEIHSSMTSGTPLGPEEFRLIILSVDILCLWYLGRKEFRDLCIEYRNQINEFKMVRRQIKRPPI